MNDTFISLASFERERLQPKKITGNVIKRKTVICTGKHKVYNDEGDENQPSIIVHRNDNAVEGVEFICTCGKSSMVSFDYEDK